MGKLLPNIFVLSARLRALFHSSGERVEFCCTKEIELNFRPRMSKINFTIVRLRQQQHVDI